MQNLKQITYTFLVLARGLFYLSVSLIYAFAHLHKLRSLCFLLESATQVSLACA